MLLKWGQTGDWKALVITCANLKPNLDYSPQDDRNSIKSVERKTMKRHPYNLEAKRFNENLLPPTATQKKFLSEKKTESQLSMVPSFTLFGTNF